MVHLYSTTIILSRLYALVDNGSTRLVGGHGLGRVCDHINHFRLPHQRNMGVEGMGVAMLKGPGDTRGSSTHAIEE